MSEKPWKPGREELLKAKGKTVADVIAFSLKVLFCGINPGLYTAAVGHHFARPGNRFWGSLYYSGFTPQILSPFEEKQLLLLGLGITNIVPRATAQAAELTNKELIEGGERLKEKVIYFKPEILAILGINAFRKAFNKKQVHSGLQETTIGTTTLWVLPNPSGINAHYQQIDLIKEFKNLHDWMKEKRCNSQ